MSEWPTYTVYMATRVINNVILMPIEAESQDTALRIFSTLNDRGLPLSDADIFKSQFYKHYSDECRWFREQISAAVCSEDMLSSHRLCH